MQSAKAEAEAVAAKRTAKMFQGEIRTTTAQRRCSAAAAAATEAEAAVVVAVAASW